MASDAAARFAEGAARTSGGGGDSTSAVFPAFFGAVGGIKRRLRAGAAGASKGSRASSTGCEILGASGSLIGVSGSCRRASGTANRPDGPGIRGSHQLRQGYRFQRFDLRSLWQRRHGIHFAPTSFPEGTKRRTAFETGATVRSGAAAGWVSAIFGASGNCGAGSGMRG